MGPPRLPNNIEVIHVYCNNLTPFMVGKQYVHMLDIILSRDVYTKTTVMNMYKQVAGRLTYERFNHHTNDKSDG